MKHHLPLNMLSVHRCWLPRDPLFAAPRSPTTFPSVCFCLSWMPAFVTGGRQVCWLWPGLVQQRTLATPILSGWDHLRRVVQDAGCSNCRRVERSNSLWGETATAQLQAVAGINASVKDSCHQGRFTRARETCGCFPPETVGRIRGRVKVQFRRPPRSPSPNHNRFSLCLRALSREDYQDERRVSVSLWAAYLLSTCICKRDDEGSGLGFKSCLRAKLFDHSFCRQEFSVFQFFFPFSLILPHFVQELSSDLKKPTNNTDVWEWERESITICSPPESLCLICLRWSSGVFFCFVFGNTLAYRSLKQK